MQFDFDEIIDRRNSNSLKWDVKADELPMWVADMDFRTAPGVTEALVKRAQSGIFGYTELPEEWYAAIQGWCGSRHGFDIDHDWLLFCTGVIPAISCTVKCLTNAGDNVVVQTPVYNHFFTSIENNGRNVLENRLRYDGSRYSMDFEDLERKLADPKTSMMLLCNPQNPPGNLWTADELGRIGHLASKYNVTVLSDEIHCDITDPGFAYTPFASVSDECRMAAVTCVAPSKTFNIAGLQSSAMIIADERKRQNIERGLWKYDVAEPNAFAVDATVAAFTSGGAWLDELRAYIRDNKKLVTDYLLNEYPKIHALESHATYLYWMDCSALTQDSADFCSFVRSRTGLYLSDGAQYRGNGRGFVRMNLACPRKYAEDGLKRLKEGAEAYDNSRGKQKV